MRARPSLSAVAALLAAMALMAEPGSALAQDAKKSAGNAPPEVLELTIRSKYSPGAAISEPEALASPRASASSQPGQSSQALVAPRAAVRPPEWSLPLRKTTVSGSPVEVRMMGPDLVALVLIVPFETGAAFLTLNVQAQVWHRLPDGSLSYKSTIQTLELPIGERLMFFPLGIDARGEAPISLEIGVDKVQ